MSSNFVVVNSQSNFNSVNTGKYSAAAELNEVRQNCLSAEKYLEGTDKTLNGFGAQIVGELLMVLSLQSL